MVSDAAVHVARSHDLFNKVSPVLQERGNLANQRFTKRMRAALTAPMAGAAMLAMPWDVWAQWSHYVVDAAERWVFFWDTLRQGGDNFVEQSRVSC
jgi:hypothetical protein